METEEDPVEAARRLARKRPREQLNCSECYRRKQKCEQVDVSASTKEQRATQLKLLEHFARLSVVNFPATIVEREGSPNAASLLP